MASITFTIGSNTYAALANSSGRKALAIKSGRPDYELKRFRPPGVYGNYIIRCGIGGMRITARARYVGKLADVFAWIAADRFDYAEEAMTIIDDGGVSYQNCNLTDFERTSDPIFCKNGTSSLVFVDAQLVFTWDGDPA